MKTKIKKVFKAIKKWDKRNTTFHSSTYMLMFITASAVYLHSLNSALANGIY